MRQKSGSPTVASLIDQSNRVGEVFIHTRAHIAQSTNNTRMPVSANLTRHHIPNDGNAVTESLELITVYRMHELSVREAVDRHDEADPTKCTTTRENDKSARERETQRRKE